MGTSSGFCSSRNGTRDTALFLEEKETTSIAKNLQTCAGKEQDRRSFFQWKRVSLWRRNIHSCYGGVMGKVIVGATMSLDWFMNDRNGDVSRLYPDLQALRRTEMLQEEIQTTGAVVMGRRAYDMAEGDLTDYEFQVPIFVLTHHVPEQVAKLLHISPAPFAWICCVQKAVAHPLYRLCLL